MYKSQGREQFEKAVHNTHLSSETPYQVVKCQKLGSLETWLKQEFPTQNYELVVSGLDFEIWKTQTEHYVEVLALQKMDKATQTCTYQFLNEDVWNKYQDQFVQEIESHFLIAE